MFLSRGNKCGSKWKSKAMVIKSCPRGWKADVNEQSRWHLRKAGRWGRWDKGKLWASQRGNPAPADCCQVVLNCEKSPSLKILDLYCLSVKLNTPASCIDLWVTSLYPWPTGRYTLTIEILSGLMERALKCFTPAEIPVLSPQRLSKLEQVIFFFSFFPHLYF